MKKIKWDWKAASCRIEFAFQEENFSEDIYGDIYNPKAAEYARGIVREYFKKSKSRHPTDIILHLEEECISHISNMCDIARMNGYEPRSQYEITIGFRIDSPVKLRKTLRAFDSEGRNSDCSYIDAAGLVLYPQGRDGPIIVTESSYLYDRGDRYDEDNFFKFDEWVETRK